MCALRILCELDEVVFQLERAERFKPAKAFEGIGFGSMASHDGYSLNGGLAGKNNDDRCAPNRQQDVADGISYGISERDEIALGNVLNGAERGGRCIRARERAAQNHVVESKRVLSEDGRNQQRDERNKDASSDEREADGFNTGDEAGASLNADDRDEDGERKRVKSPLCTRRYIAEGWVLHARDSLRQGPRPGRRTLPPRPIGMPATTTLSDPIKKPMMIAVEMKTTSAAGDGRNG